MAKNGEHLATVGCLDRGILGVHVASDQEGLVASVIEVPGHRRPDEIASWALGRVKAGDVVAFHLLANGRRTRPTRHERKTEKRGLAEAKRALRIARKRRSLRIAQLEHMLETGRFERPAKRVGVRGPALRVWIDEEEACTASAAGGDRVVLRLESVFRPRDASPLFEARVTATTPRQILYWDLPGPLRAGAVIRVQVLRSGHATRHQRTFDRAQGPSSRAQVKREIEALKQSERSHARHVMELERRMAMNLRRRTRRKVGGQ